MEKNSKAKRNRNRKNEEEITKPITETIDEDSDRYILKKYFDKNIEELNQIELRRLKVYIDEIRSLLKNLKNQNHEALTKQIQSTINNTNKIEYNIIQHQTTKKALQHKHDLLKKENEENLKKTNDKEKFSNLLLDKIKKLNEEKIKIIQEITEKRNEIVVETENYVKDMQQKFQSELPEKQKLIEENQRLRSEIDEFAKKSVFMKEQIEKEIEEKEKKCKDFTEDYLNRANKTLEKAKYERDYLTKENMRYKNEIEQYSKTKPDRDSTYDKWISEHAKFLNDIENKKKEFILISKENMELKMNMNNSVSIEKLNELNKDFTKTKNQLNAMTNLGKKYQDQIEKIIAEYPDLNSLIEEKQN